VLSIKLFDKNLNEIPVFNLTTPIEIFIKRSEKMMNLKKCIFFDEEITNWNTTGCETQEIGEYIICSCIHLTDFSLGKYNPISLFKDILSIVADAWIINDFKVFLQIKFSNAYMVYVFLVILIIYMFALRTAIKKDLRDENDLFVFQIEEEPQLCSNVDILKKLELLKEMVDRNEVEMKVTALKFLQFKIESSLSERREIIIDNGQILDNNKLNASVDLNRNSFSYNNSSNKSIKGSFVLDKDRTNSWLGVKNEKIGVIQKVIGKIIKNKEGALNEQTSDLNCESDDFNPQKENKDNNHQEIELQNIQIADNPKENNDTSKKENGFFELELNQEDESKNESDKTNQFNIKVSIDGLNIRILDEYVDHKNFIMNLYNDENQELKQEIDKFFSIERKKSIKSNKEAINIIKSDSEIKRDSIKTENTDLEKANSSAFKIDFNSFNSNLNNEDNKNSILSSKIPCKNTILDEKDFRNDELIINRECIEDSFNNSSSFRKNSKIMLIEKIPEELKSQVINPEDDVQVRIKNYKFIRYFLILKHFFNNNYRILCLIYYSNMPFSKTNFLTLIFSRIIVTLGVGTMLSLRFNPVTNKSIEVI